MQMGAQVGLLLKHPLLLFAFSSSFLTLSGLVGFIISAAREGFGFLNKPPVDKSHHAGADTQVLPLTETLQGPCSVENTGMKGCSQNLSTSARNSCSFLFNS